MDNAAFRRILDRPRKSDHHLDIRSSSLLERVLQREEISYSRPTRIRNDHHLSTGIPRPSDRGKRVDNDRALLHEILRMKVFVLDDRFRRLTDWNLRIILRRFDDLITRLVGRVVGKHIVDKALLYRLPHRVGMERAERSVLLPRSENIKRHIFRSRRECEVTEILVLSVRAHHQRKLRFGRRHIFLVDFLPRLFLIFGNGIGKIAKRDFQLRRALPGLT